MGDVIQLFKDMGPAKIFAFAGVILVLVISFFLLSSKMVTHSLSPLYSELDVKDAGEIASELDAKNIPYEIRANGTQILVPEDQMLRLRLDMASKGLPSKGSVVGYEIFDKSEALGTSNFVQNVNLLRALEGELARTISSFNVIESARVHLVIPKRELFSRDKQQPSASIILRMRGSNKLSKDEINAISHLVATAVPGLEVNKITIVDNKGRSLKLGTSESDEVGGSVQNSDDFRISYENRMRNMVEELLARSLGEGKVKAQVSAEINFDRVITNSEIYEPDGQVVRSVHSREEKDHGGGNSSDSVSVTNNLPNGQGSGGANAGGGPSSQVSDEVTNYEISKKVVNHISESGTIKRLSLAVLVDGNYEKDETDGKFKYLPRSDDELKKLEALVKSAVGFDETRKDKIEVVNMQFITDMQVLEEESTQDWLKRELPSIVQSVVIGIVVVLVLIFIVRPIAIRAFELHKTDEDDPYADEAKLNEQEIASLKEQAERDMKINEAAEKSVDIDIMSKKFKSGSIKTINDFAGKYPEETLSIIRSWLSKD